VGHHFNRDYLRLLAETQCVPATGNFAHPKAEGGFAYPTVKESLQLIAPQMSSEDKTSLERFIRKCLVFQPEDRPTASDLLNDAWFNDA
jgi:serine/threonine protein kinase